MPKPKSKSKPKAKAKAKPKAKSKAKLRAKPLPKSNSKSKSKSKVKPIPKGMHTVTPHLVCADAAKAIKFYKKAFGAVELACLQGPDGKIMHASVRIGDSPVMLVDEYPAWGALGPNSLKGTPVTLHLYVDDADKFVARAARAGAKVTMPVSEAFWGDRYGRLEDPFGHKWSVATHVRDMSPKEIRKAMPKMDG